MSKSQIEWISDRTPSAADGNKYGFVLTVDGSKRWNHVNPGEWWIHIPRSPRTGEDVIRDMINHTLRVNVPHTVDTIRSAWFEQLQIYREELKKFYPSKGESK